MPASRRLFLFQLRAAFGSIKAQSVVIYRRDAKNAKMNIEELGTSIIGAAIRVHRSLGPGLLESAYQKCLEYELRNEGLRVECERVLPVVYETVRIDAGYRIDMLVEELIIIENKTVERILPLHEAQLLTYLKLKGCALGYVLNWHVPALKDGIKRMVNRL